MSLAYAVFLPTFAAALVAVRLVLGWLRRRQFLDRPNERSSHSLPTPRGGGLAVTPVCLLAWAILAAVLPVPPGLSVAGAGAAGLMALSWADDRQGLSARLRLAVHLGACAVGLFVVPDDLLVFQGALPLWADRLVALLGWVWFVNLYNFMDGIDGITGVESASVALGLACLRSEEHTSELQSH